MEKGASEQKMGPPEATLGSRSIPPDTEEAGAAGGKPPARPWLRRFAWPLAALFWLVGSFGSISTEEADTTAEKSGSVAGSLVFPLLVGLIARLLYTKVARRRDSLPYWSPWIFVIAGVVGLVATFATAGERVQGDSASDIAACVQGGLEAFDETSAEEKTALAAEGITREKAREIAVRACHRADEEGLLDEGFDAAKTRAITLEVIAEMRARGELPAG
jgi:hypothetical protein